MAYARLAGKIRLELLKSGMTGSRAADLIVLLTGDTDLIPAMKLARGRGRQLANLEWWQPSGPH